MSVIGFGDPVLDLITHVHYSVLDNLHMKGGGCDSISQQELDQLLTIPDISNGLSRHPGGSAANVCKGLAGIHPPNSSSRSIAFIGMTGNDGAAQEYTDGLTQYGVQPLTTVSTSGAPTARCLCLITPDGQRTMRTCLGAALELNSPSQLPQNTFSNENSNLRLLHCEGYSLYRAEVTKHAIQMARNAGASVSLDLASFEVVWKCWESLSAFLEEKLVDILFCNEDEATELYQIVGLGSNNTNSGASNSNEKQQQHEDDNALTVLDSVLGYLLQFCSVVVISRGKKGCIAGSSINNINSSISEKKQQQERVSCPASSVDVIDTVGAGDHFTAGFLYGWLEGASLQVCVECACAAGTAAVQCAGANLDQGAREKLREVLRKKFNEDARFLQ